MTPSRVFYKIKKNILIIKGSIARSLLYPKSMLFNLRDVSSKKSNPYVIMYNAYKINNASDYYSFYSNWQYKTDVLPLNNNNLFKRNYVKWSATNLISQII